MGRLDLAVLFTPSTPNRQNRNQVRWNICAGVRRSTPSSEVVQTEQSRDLFQKRWRITACMHGNDLYRLFYSGVLQSAQCYLFMWLFWCTPSTLNIAKSSPPHVKSNIRIVFIHHVTHLEFLYGITINAHLQHKLTSFSFLQTSCAPLCPTFP